MVVNLPNCTCAPNQRERSSVRLLLLFVLLTEYGERNTMGGEMGRATSCDPVCEEMLGEIS